jgi:hypothetical protein
MVIEHIQMKYYNENDLDLDLILQLKVSMRE